MGSDGTATDIHGEGDGLTLSEQLSEGYNSFQNVVVAISLESLDMFLFCTPGSRREWCFMCELQKHVQRVKGSQVPVSPLNILSRIRKIGSHPGYSRQEDAHEIMR